MLPTRLHHCGTSTSPSPIPFAAPIACLLLPAFLLALPPAAARADVVYCQNFPVPAGLSDNQPFTLDYWNLHAGASAQTPTTVATYGQGLPSAGISYSGGGYEAPTATQVNAHSAGPNDSRTFYYAGQDTHYLGNALSWTDEFSINRSLTSITRVTWWHYDTYDRSGGNGNNSGGDERVAVRIAAQWFVAPNSDIINPTPSGNASHWWFDAFSWQSTNWIPLSFTPGSYLNTSITSSTTGAATLPDGVITAFGLYQIVPNGNLSRFDTFTIEANPVPVPEPAAAFLLAAAPGLLLLRRPQTARPRLRC
jgi:hypothetical protein